MKHKNQWTVVLCVHVRMLAGGSAGWALSGEAVSS